MKKNDVLEKTSVKVYRSSANMLQDLKACFRREIQMSPNNAQIIEALIFFYRTGNLGILKHIDKGFAEIRERSQGGK